MAVVSRASRTKEVAHCRLDDWDFDPSITDGACPICGWVADGYPKVKPRWRQVAETIEWEYVGLLVLFAVLVCLGVLVAQAAGIIHL
ncbi:MAG: hypothetical protein QOE92_836 [Chloroflexota bacterium]|jgi:hypothetical protein|nr:hypothetical protein [Chloroflexota bacterium]